VGSYLNFFKFCLHQFCSFYFVESGSESYIVILQIVSFLTNGDPDSVQICFVTNTRTVTGAVSASGC